MSKQAWIESYAMKSQGQFKIWQNSSSSWENPLLNCCRSSQSLDRKAHKFSKQRPIKKFWKVFLRAWSVISFKGYFIQQDFHTLGAPEARLKLIEVEQTKSFSEPNVKQCKVFVVRDSRLVLKITKSIARTKTFHRVPQGRWSITSSRDFFI